MRSNKSLPFFQGEVIKNVRCVDISNQGFGVVKVNNFTIFTRSLITDETADIQILSVYKNYAIAKVINLIDSSKYRLSKNCINSSLCSASKYQDIDYDYQISIKEAQMEKLFGFPVEVIKAENILNYRNKSEFFYHNKQFNMYDYDKKLVPINNCNLSNKLINEYLPIVLEAINNNKRANITSVIFRYSKFEDKLMLILVAKEENKNHLKIAQEIIGYSNKVKTIILNTGNSENYLFNENEKVLYGDGYLIDELFRKKFKITSKSFYQVNRDQTINLYSSAIKLAGLKSTNNIADLYCGVGTIGIIASDHVNHVTGIEVVKEAVIAAEDNINLNDISNYDVIEQDLNKDVKSLSNLDLAIVDPPRSGLSKLLLENIASSDLNKLVYISCNPYTQKRDIDYLIEKGFKIESLVAVDMFPNTEHVECVALMSRVEK